MNELAKKIITIISIIILAIFTIMSLFQIAIVKNFFENVYISMTTSIGLIIYLTIDFIFIILLKIFQEKINKNKKSKIIKIALMVIAIISYAIISFGWVNNSEIVPVDDSQCVNELAVKLAERRYRIYKK